MKPATDIQVKDLFRDQGPELLITKGLAFEVSILLEGLSPFIQHNTEAVCAYCQKVCCIRRHFHYDFWDLVYMCALGEEIPLCKEGADDSEPCGFLEERGCTLRRSLRPYRCNWFFCAPLLEQVRSNPVAQYRRFIGSLHHLTQKRGNLINKFSEVAGKTGSILEI